jgi:hypothetical protein
MPLAQAYRFDSLKLNPEDTILAVSEGIDVNLFNFNGDKPITPLAGSQVIGKSVGIPTLMA